MLFLFGPPEGQEVDCIRELDFRLPADCLITEQRDGLKTFPRKVFLTPFRIPSDAIVPKE